MGVALDVASWISMPLAICSSEGVGFEGGESEHLASFLRQISMNCLMSETSRGMTGENYGGLKV